MNAFQSQNELDAQAFDLSHFKKGFRLTRNFTVGEFASNDGHTVVLVHPALYMALQHLRDYFARPIQINSGYRSPAHNKAIGGAPASYHVKGMAADITIEGVKPLEISSVAHDLGLGGIKAYPSFCHVDVGPRRTW